MNITDFRTLGNVKLPIGQKLNIVYPVATSAILYLTYKVNAANYNIEGTPISIWRDGTINDYITFPPPPPAPTDQTTDTKYKEITINVGDLPVTGSTVRCEVVIFNFPGLETSAHLEISIDGNLVIQRDYSNTSSLAQMFAEEWSLMPNPPPAPFTPPPIG